MPTLPLYISPPCPNAWHRVLSPGGYERWHFDAEDAASDTIVVIDFFDGVTFDEDYLRRYQAYRRRSRQNAPPTPREYPGIYIAVSKGGKTILEKMLRFPAGAFEGSVERPTFSIARSGVTLGQAGAYRVRVEDQERGWAADLTLTPRLAHSAAERATQPREPGVARHFWVVAAPLCEVSGMLTLASPGETVEFRGSGYHDHHYGTAPIGYGLTRWLRARVLTEDRAIMCQIAAARDLAASWQEQLIEADAHGVRNIDGQRWDAGRQRGDLWFPYPESFGCEAIRFSEPLVIGAGLGALWLTYSARLADGSVTRALCEIGV